MRVQFQAVQYTSAGKAPVGPVTASIESGHLVALVGADGAGKSTLLRMLAGVLPPQAGDILVGDRSLIQQTQSVQANIGYMPQKFGLYEDLSLDENLSLYGDLFGLDAVTFDQRKSQLLKMTGLGSFGQRLAGKLSGGMKQKLGLACALLNHPKLLILDEPTVGIDPLSRKELWEILRQFVQMESMTVVVATTYMDEAALCDDVLILEAGQLRHTGTPKGIAQAAEGLVYSAKSADFHHVRLLQAHLMDAHTWILDAVPEADGVQVVVTPGTTLEKLRQAFPNVSWTERTPTLEDGYLVLHASIQNTELATRTDLISVPIEAQSLLADFSQQTQPVVIDADRIVRKFGNFVAVDQTTFKVHRGEIFGLLGPNGAGKTTTFKMLCGLLPVSSGYLKINGIAVDKARETVREKLGYMAQKFALYRGLSVWENLNFFAGAYGLKGTERLERIQSLLKIFNLTNVAQVETGRLSGGIAQRLAMAVALAHYPQVLFLDEPTSGADIPTRRQFWRMITALAQEGVTVIVTTHFMQEALYCDRILIQDAGRVLTLGTPQSVRGDASSMDAAFIQIVQRARQQEGT